jgi:hypothetical protein
MIDTSRLPGSGKATTDVMNVKATITGGAMDEELSIDVAFHAAGADAVNKAMRFSLYLPAALAAERSLG